MFGKTKCICGTCGSVALDEVGCPSCQAETKVKDKMIEELKTQLKKAEQIVLEAEKQEQSEVLEQEKILELSKLLDVKDELIDSLKTEKKQLQEENALLRDKVKQSKEELEAIVEAIKEEVKKNDEEEEDEDGIEPEQSEETEY